MPENYQIYVLDAAAVTVTGGKTLDGVTQGDGSHLPGETIMLTGDTWTPIAINDDDGGQKVFRQ